VDFFARCNEGNDVAAVDGCGMPVTSSPTLAAMLGRGLLAFGLSAMLAIGAARAENLDQGKSGPRLFADSCATCHHSARGLAKGRISLTLFLYLREHYASNSSTAWELTSYLESVDGPPRGRPRSAAAAKPSHPTFQAQSAPRPPAAVPQH
jgi:hypothetical protein